MAALSAALCTLCLGRYVAVSWSVLELHHAEAHLSSHVEKRVKTDSSDDDGTQTAPLTSSHIVQIVVSLRMLGEQSRFLRPY